MLWTERNGGNAGEQWRHISESPEFFQKAQLHHVGLSGVRTEMAKSNTEGSFHEQQCNKGGWVSLAGKLWSPYFGEAVASGAGCIQLQHASCHATQNITKQCTDALLADLCEQQCNKGGWVSLAGKLWSPYFGEAVASGAGYIQLQHASCHATQNITKQWLIYVGWK
jgi:hypothetical protein